MSGNPLRNIVTLNKINAPNMNIVILIILFLEIYISYYYNCISDTILNLNLLTKYSDMGDLLSQH